MATKDSDPLDINGRLYKQLGKLLDDMEALDAEEKMTMPQRISALVAVGRVQKMFVDLKKGEFSVGRGSAIERYTEAFQTPHAARGGTDDAGLSFDGRDEDDIRDELGDA
jgi:hypothetical protein